MRTLKIRIEKIVDVQDWNSFVEEVYNRPYNFQQQSGCQSRGTRHLTLPDEAEDYENNSVPEIINHALMGVSFAAWLARDPKQPIRGEEEPYREWVIKLWWHRNFYPDIQMVANDLHAKGLLEAGNYTIIIDW